MALYGSSLGAVLRRRLVASAALVVGVMASEVAFAAPIFAEQWEGGSAAWSPLSGGPVVLTADPAIATRTYQRETVGASGGRVRATAATTVTPSTTYCLSAWIRGGVNSCPFIGIDTNLGERWLIGQTNYNDGYGGKVTPVVPDGAWHWYSKEFTTTATETSLRVKDEMFGGCAVSFSDFDAIEVEAGACAATPRIVYGDTVHCTGPTPVATMANACVGCTGDFSSGATDGCPSGTAPYCKNDGTCGACQGASDCANRPGTFCSPSTGACIANCEVDAQCAAAMWCSNVGGPGTCQTKVANGQPVPGGTCSVAIGGRACASGACNTTTNACGLGLGQGPCSGDGQCTSGVCVGSGGADAGADAGGAGDGGAGATTCVECRAKTDCSTPGLGACDTTTNACVECVVNSDCTGALPVCGAGHTCQAAPPVDAGTDAATDAGADASSGGVTDSGSADGSSGGPIDAGVGSSGSSGSSDASSSSGSSGTASSSTGGIPNAPDGGSSTAFDDDNNIGISGGGCGCRSTTADGGVRFSALVVATCAAVALRRRKRK